MGPGYMPMLVFWILMGLGIIVLGTGLLQRARPDGEVDGHRRAVARARDRRRHGAFRSRRMFSSFFETSYGNLGVGMLVGFLVICWSAGWRLIGYICAASASSACCWRRAG